MSLDEEIIFEVAKESLVEVVILVIKGILFIEEEQRISKIRGPTTTVERLDTRETSIQNYR